MKKRSRAQVYDRLYALADKMLKRHNPCQDCIVHNCFGDFSPQRCCVGCPHFNNGCTVKALYCKLWLCNNVTRHDARLKKRLRRLEKIAEKYDLLVARASRKESLKYGEALNIDKWWFHHCDHIGMSRAQSHKRLQCNLVGDYS